MENITYSEYCNLLETAKKFNPKVDLNVSSIEYEIGSFYFKSKEGISWLKSNGMLGGLARFKEGTEKIAKVHQELRINLGGSFLECFDTKLVEIYKKQGFHKVAAIPFNTDFAPKGWKKDIDLINKPDVVFLSLHYKPYSYFLEYSDALNYTQVSKNYLCRAYVTGHDKTNITQNTLFHALKTINKTLGDVKTVVNWANNIDIFFKDTRDYIRIYQHLN